MATPNWAEKLLLDALCYLESTGLTPILPSVTWRHGQHKLSSGCTYHAENRIVVTAGTDRLDAKLVLLHELAHAQRPGEHHTPEFWALAWELYHWAKLPIAHCKAREGNYRKGALVAYHNLGRKISE